ncbi:hypothetical protein VB779_08750 [Haloarculaceae archaeon H-GB11]|nr:hypothetical protein [Haloarculaceae archaeon H-GB11]
MATTQSDTETVTDASNTDLDERDRRALEQYLTVLPAEGRAAGAPDLYTVVSQSGKSYLVDLRLGRCECPDAEHRDPDGGCKHVRRVEFATGARPVPGDADVTVDSHLGEHVQSVATDGGIIVAGDDGELVDDDGRPDDCDCGSWNADTDLPCWPCTNAGFETPAEDNQEGEF